MNKLVTIVIQLCEEVSFPHRPCPLYLLLLCVGLEFNPLPCLVFFAVFFLVIESSVAFDLDSMFFKI